jgi:hypothetical protein
VDDRERVGGTEGVGRLAHDPADLVDRELAPAANAARHGLPVHVAHDEVDQAVPLADRVDRHDVGMAELGGGLGLAGEPLPDVQLECQLGREDLDGDAPLEPLVPSAVDHPHPASADFPFDRIRVAHSRGEADRQRLVGGSGHGKEGPGEEDAGPRSANWPAEEQPDMAANLYSRKVHRHPPGPLSP